METIESVIAIVIGLATISGTIFRLWYKLKKSTEEVVDLKQVAVITRHDLNQLEKRVEVLESTHTLQTEHFQKAIEDIHLAVGRIEGILMKGTTK